MAHDLNKKWRSDDVKIKDNLDFSSLLLSQKVLAGLKQFRFIKPSPIQLQAIPLGRCGLDLIVQAKSGTGKTCVFTVIALEGLLAESTATQVLVLAPTREIAFQIKEVITSIGSHFTNLRCGMFIGGMPLDEDKNNLINCQIAVGTPGRIKHLIELGALKTTSIRLLVLDEADKLLDENFQKSINWIYQKLPSNKQMLALSATYPEALANLLKEYMRNPFFIRLNADQPALIGIKQFYSTTAFHQLQHIAFKKKVERLLELLKEIHFSQCLVFSNSQVRAESLCETLTKNGWPAVYISAAQDQAHRQTAMMLLKTFQCRILVSTDLTSRGIDAENVNLIINMEVARDLETYLHRIGRAGRFGSQGLAITLVSKGADEECLLEIATKGRLDIMSLPKNVPEDLWSYSSESSESILNLVKPPRSSVMDNKEFIEKTSSSVHLPKSSDIKLVTLDFQSMKEENFAKEVAFQSIKELMADYNSFTLIECTKKDVDPKQDVGILNEDEALNPKISSYLKESKENFWNAVAKNYFTVDEEDVPIERKIEEISLLETVAVQDDNAAETLDTTIFSETTSGKLKTLQSRLPPAPELLSTLTDSKRRMLEFYQNQLKGATAVKDSLTITTVAAGPSELKDQIPSLKNSKECSSGAFEQCDEASTMPIESDDENSSSSSSDEDSLSEEEYYPNHATSQIPTFPHYQYPNMNNSIQRAYRNYSNYMGKVMQWRKEERKHDD